MIAESINFAIMIINNDTIVALATPAGGAIGIIRMSGPASIEITEKLFDKPLQNTKGYTLHYGILKTVTGEDIDDVMVSVYHAPRSYTGEDCIEVSCHGSGYILRQALQAFIDAGARQAQPGEYTRRAYMNGKMDLSQAEAVADLVSASNRATHKLALSQLKGHFSSELSLLRNQLLKMTSLLELELDFSDHEDLEFADRSELKALAEKIDNHISTLAHSFKTGNTLKQGIPVSIIGKTNVGKSTLLNRLLHEDKAIVSDINGTTRDIIEDTTQIHGITFRFIDTAGIRHTDDKIEQLGIERALQKLNESTVVIWLLDAQPTDAEITEMQNRCEGKKLLVVFNKSDLAVSTCHIDRNLVTTKQVVLHISAKTGEGIAELEDTLYHIADVPEINENSVIVTNVRHYEALTKAHASIQRVIDGMDMDLSGDLLAEDLRMCLDELADITGGKITPQETLNNIFSHFCIGK